MTPQIVAACAASVLALAAGPVAATRAAEPVLTIADPAGPVVIDSDAFAHWRDVARRGGSGGEGRDLDHQVLGFLVSSAWIIGESRQHGVLPSEAETLTAFRQQRSQSFPTEREYRRFLRETGYTEADLLYRIRVQEAGNRLRETIIAPVRVSPDAVTDELRAHPDRFYVEERRDFVHIQTRTPAQARAAAAAVRGGESIRSVARRMSMLRSGRRGGLRLGRERDDLAPGLADRVFAARPGTVVGPVWADGRWHVFRVLAVHPRHRMSRALARQTARQLLLGDAQQQVIDAFVADLQARWRARTTCAAAYTWFAECGNGPAPAAVQPTG